jgi:hypothetical protein
MPEHSDCNRSFFLSGGPPGLPEGVAALDPETCLYAPPVIEIDGQEHRWWLADAEEEARRHPEAFFIPPLERRQVLEPGDSVRLIFRFSPRGEEDPSAERMWVLVAGVDARGYAGYLTNQPHAIKGLNARDVIAFGPHHIASIEVDKGELGFDPESRAFVSRRVAEGTSFPGFLVLDPESERRPPRVGADGLELIDSGWQLLAGDETEEELEDPNAILLRDLGWVAERHPQLLPLVQADVPGEWTWDGSGYRRVA